MAAASAPIEVGTAFPEVTVHKVGEEIKTSGSTMEGKLVLVGVPGAFTPTCHLKHLPSYVEQAAQFKEAGAKLVFTSVNDAFVMKAWGAATGADEAGIDMWADPKAELAKALGVDFEVPALGGVRSQRYAAFVEDGTVKHLALDKGDESSFAAAMLKVVKGE